MSAVADAIADIYALSHRNALDAVTVLSEDQVRWRPPAELPLPVKEDLVAYATRAFDAADRAVGEVRDDDLARNAEFDPASVPWASPSDYGTVANWIVAGIRHDSRHLGMMEALKGVVRLRGTATR